MLLFVLGHAALRVLTRPVGHVAVGRVAVLAALLWDCSSGQPHRAGGADCGNSPGQLLPASPGCCCCLCGFITLTCGLDTLLQVLQPDRV